MQTKNANKISVISGSGRSLPVSRRMWGSRKGFMAVLGPVIVIGAIVVLGVAGVQYSKAEWGWFGGSKDTTLSVAGQDSLKDKVGTNDIAVDPETNDVMVSSCGLNGYTNYDLVSVNPLDDDGTPTYPSVAFKIQDASKGGALMSYTTDTDGTFASSSLQVNCPGEYNIFAPAVQNATASYVTTVKMGQPRQNDLIEIEQVDDITTFVYDEKNRGFVFMGATAAGTPYELNESRTFKSTTNNTAYAMGTGGSLDWSFTVYTAATQRSWGDLKNYVLVDADMSDYAKPTVYWNNQPLQEVGKSALRTDDAAYLSAYEYVFALPSDITEVQDQVRLKVNAKSGQDPDIDMNLRFAAESLYVDGTQVKQGIFNAGGNEIMRTNEVTIDVS